ncbi:hypothetical protein C1645_828093 [Glomus cerebriforme]|uniref:Uncharacterized protein n=1 Tax=Glomus cerebriforme TaxID=658196 RepID=A0A397SWT6_9GLOM|nr:hypothetical protein C1645_828093 [Glomus cerebriforme]
MPRANADKKYHCPYCKSKKKSSSIAMHCKKHQWICNEHNEPGEPEDPWVQLWEKHAVNVVKKELVPFDEDEDSENK